MVNSYPSGGDLDNTGRNAAYITIDGAEVGFTLEGFDYNPEVNTTPVQFNEDAQPQGELVSEQNLVINLTLAELTNQNFIYFHGGLATLSGSDVLYGDKRGVELTKYAVYLYFLHTAEHPLSGKVFQLHQCTIKPAGGFMIDPTADGYEGLPITIEVKKDTSKSAGEEFFKLTAAVTTAPTVSSTSPVDGASGVAVDAAITVTFSAAMGLASFKANETVIVTSTGKTSTAFDDVITISSLTLNTAGTTLTIAHTADDFGGTTEYQVTLTNVRSAYGVAMAAPYVFDFTSA